MSIKKLHNYKIKLHQLVDYTEMGNVTRIRYMLHRNNSCNIKRLNADNYIYLDMRFKVLPDKEFTKADLLLANTDDYEVQKKLTKNGVKKVRIRNNTSACHGENGKIFGYKILSLNVQIILEQ